MSSPQRLMNEEQLAELFDEFMTNLALNNGTTEY